MGWSARYCACSRSLKNCVPTRTVRKAEVVSNSHEFATIGANAFWSFPRRGCSI
jgi:hypothetical protein